MSNQKDDITAENVAPSETEKKAHQATVTAAAALRAALAPVGKSDLVPPDPAPPSAGRRLRLHVPNVATTVTLGKSAGKSDVRPEDAGPVNYDGFGVHTDGHVYMVAEGHSALKSKESVTIQSAKSTLDVRSKESALFGSDKNTFIHGHAGTMIVGGAVVQPGAVEAIAGKWIAKKFGVYNDAKEPDDKWQLPNLAEIQESQNKAAALVKKVAGVMIGVETALGFTWAGGWLGRSIGLAPAALGALRVGMSLAEGKPGRGVGIHGTESVLITSPKLFFAHAHAQALMAGTKDAEVVGGVAARLAGGISAFVGATLTTVGGVASAKLISGFATEVACRGRELLLRAPTMTIGKVEAEFTQRPTAKINIVSNDSIAATAGKKAGIAAPAVVLQGKRVSMRADVTAGVSSKKWVAIAGDKGASLVSKEKVLIGAKDTSIQLSKGLLTIGIGPDVPAPPELDEVRNPRAHKEFVAGIPKQADKVNAYYKKLAKAKPANQAKLVFKPGKIEILLRGMKFQLDESKIKSGALTWKK